MVQALRFLGISLRIVYMGEVSSMKTLAKANVVTAGSMGVPRNSANDIQHYETHHNGRALIC